MKNELQLKQNLIIELTTIIKKLSNTQNINNNFPRKTTEDEHSSRWIHPKHTTKNKPLKNTYLVLTSENSLQVLSIDDSTINNNNLQNTRKPSRNTQSK